MARKGYTLTRERVNRQGYTSNGRYFGAGGSPLYYYDCGRSSDRFGYFRAKDRKAAREELFRICPNLRPPNAATKRLMRSIRKDSKPVPMSGLTRKKRRR